MIGQGEIKRRIQPDGYTVDYHYDTEERLIGVTNQRGETYHLHRDPLGRIIEEVDYWNQSRRYAYTTAGHLAQSIDPLERVINYQTDKLGRIVKKILIEADGTAVGSETFAYDANGNLTAAQNAAVKIQRSFDAEGRLVEEKQGGVFVIRNKYDLNGNRSIRTTPGTTPPTKPVEPAGYMPISRNRGCVQRQRLHSTIGYLSPEAFEDKKVA